MLIPAPRRRYLDWFTDSRRWDGYQPGLAAWIEKGRLGAGEPRELVD